MYIPPSFLESDTPTLHKFIEQNSFGLLISQHSDAPFATHLPFLLDRTLGAHGTLFGHMARANPQWEPLPNQRCLAVFSGPHTYISPTCYEAANLVPTWNYVAVHAYGTAELIEDCEALLNILRRSVEVYERSMPQPWKLGEVDTFLERLLQQIVGFRIPIETLEGKWKLNQNHTVQRREKVVRALENQGDENSMAIANLMRSQLTEASFTDAELLAAFHSGTITHKQWSHRAHLRIAYLLVHHHGWEAAITQMRDGLQKLNAIHGSPNLLMRGYHETITVAFLRLIHQRLSTVSFPATSVEFCAACPELLDKQLLLQYYSLDRLWSWDAKQAFLEPDVKPLMP